MRIAVALMVALMAAGANAQTAAREAFITVSGEGHVERRPGICGVLRRRRHPRRKP